MDSDPLLLTLSTFRGARSTFVARIHSGIVISKLKLVKPQEFFCFH